MSIRRTKHPDEVSCLTKYPDGLNALTSTPFVFATVGINLFE